MTFIWLKVFDKLFIPHKSPHSSPNWYLWLKRKLNRIKIIYLEVELKYREISVFLQSTLHGSLF